jgi:hypothetical protein
MPQRVVKRAAVIEKIRDIGKDGAVERIHVGAGMHADRR